MNAIQPAKALLIAAVIGLGLSGGFAAAAFLPGGSAPAAVSQIWDQTVGQMFGNGLGEKGSYITAAATYIGITEAQLRTELGTDKSLADVAIAHGKTRDGLIAALTAAQQQNIATLVDQKGIGARPNPALPMITPRRSPTCPRCRPRRCRSSSSCSRIATRMSARK